jgi:membrane associated rhomboid family serine protease
MKAKKELHFSTKEILYPLLFLFSIVFIFWVESRFSLNFNYLGIYPRKLVGLRGIFFGPFIHSDIKHLFNNSIPLFVLTTDLFYFYKNIRWKVLVLGILLTGVFTWLIGRPSLHIGASGVIYMLTSFLMFKGIFSKQYQLTALSFDVIFLYGSFIWYVFPTDPKISWEGHLSGFVVGFLFSLFFKKIPLEKKKYEWEKDNYIPEEDEFMKQFDDNGNFIDIQKEALEPEEEIQNTPPIVRIRYSLKKGKSQDPKEL